jgi:hypothetical protein
MQSLGGLSKIPWKDFKQLWQRSMSTYHGALERMPCGALPSAFKWTEGASNTHCNYRASMVSSFDTVRRLTVTRILNIKRHRTYVVQHFRPLTRNHNMESLCANLFSFSIVLPSVRESPMFINEAFLFPC